MLPTGQLNVCSVCAEFGNISEEAGHGGDGTAAQHDRQTGMVRQPLHCTLIGSGMVYKPDKGGSMGSSAPSYGEDLRHNYDTTAPDAHMYV